MERILIFANGELNNGIAVQRALALPAWVIAADGGAHLAVAVGCTVSLLVGDMDSIDDRLLGQLEAAGCEILRYLPEKNETDLELALIEAAKRGAQSIQIIGALGGRLDQQLANIYLLNLPILDGLQVSLVAGNQTTSILPPGEHLLAGELGDTISLIPLGGAVAGISTEGLKYPLRDEVLEFGPARGVSNVMTAPQPRLRFREGKVLLIHTVGQA